MNDYLYTYASTTTPTMSAVVVKGKPCWYLHGVGRLIPRAA